MFAPYSFESRGDLEKYLQEHDGHGADNLFRGYEYFGIMKDKGYLVPNMTMVRVDQSLAPDIGYFVNADFNLESAGYGRQNMSMMGAKKGVYDPTVALKDKNWSIYGLSLDKLFRAK